MAKSVGIPDRGHSVLSSRAKARRDDRRLGTYTIEASGTGSAAQTGRTHDRSYFFAKNMLLTPCETGAVHT